MPLRREVLERDDNGYWPEPEGDIVEVLGLNRDRLKVLTRVDEIPESEPPIDPSECTVSELRSELREVDLTDDEREQIKRIEQKNDNRTTAIDAIEDA